MAIAQFIVDPTQGKITSGYRFELGKHDSGDGEELYPHYRDVEWAKTSYMPRTSLVSEGETPWQPYGTVGKVYPELPPYIARLVGVSRAERPRARSCASQDYLPR